MHRVQVENSCGSRPLETTASERWPYFDNDEIAAVTAVLRSGKVNQWTGDRVKQFEEEYQRRIGGFAIALANGSLALELALRAFGIGEGDEVIVTPRSFIASASCVRLVGATPVFADVDLSSGNMTAQSIAAKITARTKAVIPVHLAGWPADMADIMAVAEAHGLRVIEDCAQAHGAVIDGEPVGSFGDAAAFSFCQDKIITTGGEGGLVVFKDLDAYEWAWSFKDHGKSLRKIRSPAPEPGFRWLHDRVGTNWRMLEISAAIGLLQLEKLEEWRRRRAENAGIWSAALREVEGVRTPHPRQGHTHAYYKFYAYLSGDNSELRRRRILDQGLSLGIRIFTGSCSEVYREHAFADLEVKPLPNACELGASSLMFEVHPTLDQDRLRSRAAAIAELIARTAKG